MSPQNLEEFESVLLQIAQLTGSLEMKLLAINPGSNSYRHSTSTQSSNKTLAFLVSMLITTTWIHTVAILTLITCDNAFSNRAAEMELQRSAS